MRLLFIITIALVSPTFSISQVPVAVGVRILKAEDARRFDETLAGLMKSPTAEVRIRAALAVGRIGNEAALPPLRKMLAGDASADARAMAAFAIGEIESIDNVYALLDSLKTEKEPKVRMRIIEAAGKMAAAHPTNAITPAINRTILEALKSQTPDNIGQDEQTALLTLTAALRAKPVGAEEVTAKFLISSKSRIVADAANTLTRLKAKNANAKLRDLLLIYDRNENLRVNAARALGAAEDKDAFNILAAVVTSEKSPAIRIAAIRALGSLKDAKAADLLVEHGDKLFKAYKISKFAKPTEKNELLEIATVLGRILPNSRNEKALQFLGKLIEADYLQSPEISIARYKVAPGKFNETIASDSPNWRQVATLMQLLIEVAATDDAITDAKKVKTEAPGMAREALNGIDRDANTKLMLAMPDAVRAFAAFKTADVAKVLSRYLMHPDIFVRATAAELLGEQSPSKENIETLKSAFAKALLKDKDYNDAQLAILDALYKLGKRESIPSIWTAINSKDHLVRRKAFEYLREMQKDPALAGVAVEGALNPKKLELTPYVSGSKLGQLLNTQADYERAVSRRNGSVKAVFKTEKGTFTIDFFPEDAPLTVDNFVKLARSGYFNGLEVHRVVPNFVMQDGDPRGDGNGGPGWSIRCEVNMLAYERGSVGMALSGKDTGGSQWFVTHSPQPHLDGGYTVFGRVNEIDMKVVDNIVRGDKILKVMIVEKNISPRNTRNMRKVAK